MSGYQVLEFSSVLESIIGDAEFTKRASNCQFNISIDIQGMQTHQLALLSHPLVSIVFPEGSNTFVKISDFGFWTGETETLGQFLLKSVCVDDSWVFDGKTIITNDKLFLRAILFICMGYQWDCCLASEDGLSGCKVSHHSLVECFSARSIGEEDSQVLRNWAESR